MATVKGPLFSLEASGSLGGAVVYSTWKGRPYVRQHAVPANPKSVTQVSVRAMMRFLTQYWASLTSVQQADWDTRAAVTNISAFNAFISYNMSRWGQFKYPSIADPATEDDTAGVLGTAVCTAGVRSITVGFTVATLNQNWGGAIYRKIDSAPGESRAELVRVIPAVTAAAFTWLDVDVVVGTDYYYDVTPISLAGVGGTELSLGNAIPTA
jgi:hypothetical protein